MSTVIEARQLTKVYPMGEEKVHALRGVSFSVRRNEYIAIMGPSGSGKSTLLHILGCLDRPTSGELIIEGTNVLQATDNRLAEIRNRRIGFVFQNFNLMSRATALENVELPLIYAGVRKKERRERAVAVLERVGLADRLHHRPTELSGGQRQRVAIARALALEPSLVICDEAVSALDVLVQAQVLTLLNDLQSELGLTYLFITHDLAVVRQIADTVAVMEKGRIVEQATTDEVFDNPQQRYTQELLAAIPGAGLDFVPDVRH